MGGPWVGRLIDSLKEASRLFGTKAVTFVTLEHEKIYHVSNTAGAAVTQG